MEINVKISYGNKRLKNLRISPNTSQSQLANISNINLRMIQYRKQGTCDLNSESC